MSTTTSQLDSGHRLAAWTAIIGALLAWLNVGTLLAATGGDPDLLLRPAAALTLPAAAQKWFAVSMLFDSFGFYLPFLVIGAYWRSELRPRFGVTMDMATLCIGAYVLLGLAGASMQMAALPALAEIHGAGGEAVKAASESAWLVLVQATQNGLWWMEGPLMAFWGIVVGRALWAARTGFGRTLMLCGALYGAYFVAALCGWGALAELIEFGAVALLPLWMLLAGISLLRPPAR
jgi:hypothetical protein